MNQVFDWFNDNVARLESAYKEIGVKFDRISQELEEKNQQLMNSFAQNEATKTQLKCVLESMTTGVLMIDCACTVTLVNAATLELFGWENRPVLGRSIFELWPEYTKGTEPHPLSRILEEKEKTLEGEFYYLVRGIHKPLGYTVTAVSGPEGKLLGALQLTTDLTAWKSMQSQIQHAKTLAAIGEMAATVAHEIRNPLGAIGGFAGLLERDLASDDPRRSLVGKIVQGVSSLNKIVSNLLVFSRPMELQLRRIDLREWLEELLRYGELEAEQTQKSIRFELEFPFPSLEVNLDPEKFQQVLLNLIFNSMQAMESEGVINISVAREKPNMLIVQVRDTGKGIPEKDLVKIFNPFYTTREQGTGLGLAIVRRIVELHGGTISVQSQLGHSTEFVLKLPHTLL